MIDDFRAIIAMLFYKLAMAIHAGIIDEIEKGANAYPTDDTNQEKPDGQN